ncbi:MAG: hypothetical protein ABR548_06520, partial [Actinomycetota bacterium]
MGIALSRARVLVVVLALFVPSIVASGSGAAGAGSVRTRSDNFDAALPGTVPSGWIEVGSPGYHAIPDLSATSAPETLGSLGPAPSAGVRGARYGAAARNSIVQAAVRITPGADDKGASLIVRASNALTTGYAVHVKPLSNQLALERRVAGQTTVTLGSVPLPTRDGWQTVAIEAYGNAIRAKAWAGAAEPAAWQINATDTVINSFGSVGLTDDGVDTRFDDVVQFNPLAGTITAGTMASDGVPRPVTVTLLDDGTPATGRTVSIASDRGNSVDTISPASAVVNASGTATFTIASSTAGPAKLTLSVDGGSVSVTSTVVFTGIVPPVGTTYRTTFDGPAGALPAGWGQRALTGTASFAVAATGGVDPSPGALADTSTGTREYAYYNNSSFLDGSYETHAMTPGTVTHSGKVVGVAARMTPDASSMYMGMAFLDPSSADTSRRTVSIVRRLNGVETIVAAATSRSPALGQWIRVKLEVKGTSPTTVRMKVWPKYDPEPVSWVLTYVDAISPISTPGLAGVVSAAGGSVFDNFTVSSADDALRTDQLVKTGSSANAYTVVVNPVRGGDVAKGNTLSTQSGFGGYAETQTAAEHLSFSQYESAATSDYGLPATWLARYDAYTDSSFLSFLKTRPATDEIGVYLEVTPKWASDSGVTYHSHSGGSWTDASSLFLTGYTTTERTKLIDKAMATFLATFGKYPATVGAFWIDAASVKYMHDTFGVTNAMTVSENICTDGYTEWGGYFDHPYYPTKTNARMPAQSTANKLDVVMWPWAIMDPLAGYDSVFYASVPNNYMSATGLSCNAAPAKLDTTYFAQQLDLLTDTTNNPYGWFMGGLENAYKWDTYGAEYRRQ